MVYDCGGHDKLKTYTHMHVCVHAHIYTHVHTCVHTYVRSPSMEVGILRNSSSIEVKNTASYFL